MLAILRRMAAKWPVKCTRDCILLAPSSRSFQRNTLVFRCKLVLSASFRFRSAHSCETKDLENFRWTRDRKGLELGCSFWWLILEYLLNNFQVFGKRGNICYKRALCTNTIVASIQRDSISSIPLIRNIDDSFICTKHCKILNDGCLVGQ